MNPHDAGLLRALRQVRDGRIHIRGFSDLLVDGRPLPTEIAPFMTELFDHSHITLQDSLQLHGEQPVTITESGYALLAELELTIETDTE